MYEDAWYNFVPEVAKKPATGGDNPRPGHRRKESLLQQPNGAQSSEPPVPLDSLLEEIEDTNTPPEPNLPRRATSYSDFYHVVQTQLAKEARSKLKKDGSKRTKERFRDALTLEGDISSALPAPRPTLDFYDEELLKASQQDYFLYEDQLILTERHLDALIDDTNASLKLLTTLSNSFKAVETQTTSFRSQCEDLIEEKTRLQKLADDVGTDLHYYAYLDNVTRRLNAPGAGRLADDDGFGEVLEHLNSCIDFMSKHPAYRDAESYQARYEALLTKALHLLEVSLQAKLDSISSEIGPQIAATKSEATRHALAYGRFEEMVCDSFSLLPNIQRVVRSVYDEYGMPVTNVAREIYANTMSNMLSSYLNIRDRDLKPMVQHEVDEFKKEVKESSAETACRNLVKQTFERAFSENNLLGKIFGLDLQWSSDAGSAYTALKLNQRSAANPVNLILLATYVQTTLQATNLKTICSVVAWLMNEYLVLDYDEEESPFTRQCRELSARLLTEHLWAFTDTAFEAEIAKLISKTAIKDDALKIGPVVGGVSSSNAYQPVKQALELLVSYDQTMPKERSQKNSQVIFKIVRETINVLQRAESRLKSLKGAADPDLFMVKNLLIIKNELVSLEIGDIRSDGTSGMQHFGQIWDTLSPQNWYNYFSSVIGGVGSIGSSFWGSSSSAAAATVTAKTLTVEDMSEQLDELLRQSIVAFTQRWGKLMNDSKARKAGVKPIAKVEKELDEVLETAFSNQPEVIAKLHEAIQMSAQAQEQADGENQGTRRY